MKKKSSKKVIRLNQVAKNLAVENTSNVNHVTTQTEKH